jgi:hypothetical protein
MYFESVVGEKAMQQQVTRYRRPARILHWTMAAIVIAMVPLGIAVNYLPWNGFQDFLFIFTSRLASWCWR